MVAPLEDVTVIEVDNWMAAPSAAAILADLGARVIKIEPIGGDPMRDMGRPAKGKMSGTGYDFQFDVDNRGKESILVDLRSEKGIGVVHRLCEKADVFLCNLLPERQKKYKLDPDILSKVNSRLVHATLTGYGTHGPDAWRQGYDSTAFFARSGLFDASREGDEGVLPQARPAQGDHVTGLALMGAILAALRLAERTGKGQVVETSLFEAAIWSQASDYATTAVDEAPVRHRARDQQMTPTANRYPCGDGNWVVLNMPNDAYWPKFCAAIGREDWITDERYRTSKQRFDAMPELVRAVDATMLKRGRDEWGKIFDEAGLIWAPALGLHEVPSDPQAQAIGVFPTLTDEDIGEYRTVAIPMRFANADVGPKQRSPKPGEHSSKILQEAGLTDDDVAALREAGVIQ